jgi:hypothetical protein
MITTSHDLHFETGRRSKKSINAGVKKVPPSIKRIPRVAKIMALAIRLNQLVQDGQVKNQAELARLGHVSRARLTQIMTLLQLAPDIQEEILFLPAIERGSEPILERELRKVAAVTCWSGQRERRGGRCAFRAFELKK